MKIKLLVKNKLNEVLQTCIFEDQKTMDEFVVMISENNTFGGDSKDYIIETLDISLEEEQQKINNEAMNYLASTDYMVIRAAEDSGKPVPAEITLARIAARNRIIK